jgi:hypothetical protein
MGTTWQPVPVSRSPAPQMQPIRLLLTASRLMALLTAMAMVLALGLESPFYYSVATATISLAFACHDGAYARAGLLSPMTVYAASSALMGIANAYGIAQQFTEARATYFVYTSEEHLLLATQLALAGAVVPLAANYLLLRSGIMPALADIFPRVKGRVDDRRLVYGGIWVAAISILMHIAFRFSSLGTVGALVYLIPQLLAFTLARAGYGRGVPGAVTAGLIVAFMESTRAVMYDYLRSDLVSAIIAFVLGALMGARSLRPLKSKAFIPIYAVGVIFVVYFGAFGAVRTYTSAGISRLQTVYEAREEMSEEEIMPGDERHQTVLGRLTSFNQLSQVGRIVSQEGYLEGKTLEYLAYAFVPRVLWPEKPTIAKGSWFALRIGQAYQRPDGSINNSVNMTIPGELYLNFGWPGVLLGLVAFALLIAVLWSRTDFLSDPRNVLGAAFGYYLFWIGFILGADMQIFVTIIAVYILFVGLSFMARTTTVFTPPDRRRVAASPRLLRE